MAAAPVSTCAASARPRASNVAILVNGRKINPAADSATLYLNSIDLENIERVEIIEGSAGTLYGNQAVGGLINVITRRPGQAARTLRFGVGSFDSVAFTAGASGQLSDRIGGSLQLHRRASDNYREHNESRVERIDGRIELAHGGGYSYLEAQVLDDYVQTPGALFAGELANNRRQAVFANDYLDTRSRVVRVGTQQPLNAHWRLEAELALRDDHRDFVQSFRGLPGTLSQQDRESIEITPRLTGNIGNSAFTLGLDVLRTDYLLVTDFGPQGNDQEIAAWYGQVTQSLSPGLSLTAGLRHARVDNAINNGGTPVQLDDTVSVGSLGISYRPDPALRLFLRADQNYRFAKVDEHTNVPFGQPVGLATQRGISYESGVEYQGSSTQLSARLWQLRLRDEISFDATTFTNVNLPSSRRNGLTLSADLAVSDGLALGAGYDYIDSEIRSGTHRGSQVPLVPEHRGTLYAEYRPSAPWLLRLDVELVDEQFLGSDFSNTAQRLDSYQVANLVLQRDLGDWRLSAKINNLFDEIYSETGASSFAGDGFIPAPERNFWLGLIYRPRD